MSRSGTARKGRCPVIVGSFALAVVAVAGCAGATPEGERAGGPDRTHTTTVPAIEASEDGEALGGSSSSVAASANTNAARPVTDRHDRSPRPAGAIAAVPSQTEPESVEAPRLGEVLETHVAVESLPSETVDPLAEAVADAAGAVPEMVALELAALSDLAQVAHGGPGVGVVHHPTQMLWTFDGTELRSHVVSTGKGGVTGRPKSSGTPAGRHRIEYVVRGSAGEIVRGFGPTGRLAPAGGTAYMTTRAFALVGLEPRNATSLARGIFVHGTNMPHQLGRPLSGGCIRVSDADAILLDGIFRPGSLFSVVVD